MQKQQHNAEAVLLKECIDEYKTIVVDRYVVIQDVVFMDGFVLAAESVVRSIVSGNNKGEHMNVVYETDVDVQRIMWIKTSNLKLLSSQEEKREISEYNQEIMDKNENWFD